MPDRLGPAQADLERAYGELNKALFAGELPPVVITIQTKGRKSALGWYAPKRWKNGEKGTLPEINICAEELARGPESVLETLVHEMVHAQNAHKGIKDYSRGGKYHNRKFKDAAEAVGLTVERSKSCGFGHTALTDSLREKVLKVNLQEDAFKLARLVKLGTGKTNTPLVKWTCGCGRNFWAKVDMADVKCRRCDCYFERQG